MSKIMNAISHASDQGNLLISKSIQWVGLTSVGTGGGLSAAKSSGAISTQSAIELADIGIMVSIVGGATFIIKNIADIYFSYKKDKRENKSTDGED